jgi:hypothetical protein
MLQIRQRRIPHKLVERVTCNSARYLTPAITTHR